VWVRVRATVMARVRVRAASAAQKAGMCTCLVRGGFRVQVQGVG